MENLKFILTCLAIFTAIMLVAAFLQKKLCRDIKAFSGTHYITYTAIFAAMAGYSDLRRHGGRADARRDPAALCPAVL